MSYLYFWLPLFVFNNLVITNPCEPLDACIVRANIITYKYENFSINLIPKYNHCLPTRKKTPTATSTSLEMTRSGTASEGIDPNKYWYSGQAEISSYQLQQGRYGETHEGKAVLVFVTEPFSPSKNTKSDYEAKDQVSVLKCNFTKKFSTGIYPYSMITSTFLPYEKGIYSYKVATSIQEWCGHTYMELRNRTQFEIDLFSYFESESEKIKIDKALLEDDIWTKIRTQPKQLPEGELIMIPSFFYLRLRHMPTKAYRCIAKKSKQKEQITYTITYPDLHRTLSINFEDKFPYKILSWEEDYGNMKTTGTLIKSIQSAYWNKNSNKDKSLRTTLGLD